MSDPRVLPHVIESITRASDAHAAAAADAIVDAGTPLLEHLARRVAGSQHARPRVARRMIVVACGDHGVGDPGIALGAAHPTVIAAHEIAQGTAALALVARASQTPIVLVDAGVRERDAMPTTAIVLGRGPSRDLLREPAMTVVDAALGLEAGIALAISLADDGLDVVALGALGVGADVAAVALLAAVEPDLALDELVAAYAEADAGVRAAAERGRASVGASGLELLATFGGPETAVLAGLILGAASINVPVVLDGHATGAAAVIAARLAPAVATHLIAAHVGALVHPRLLAHLGLLPVFTAGLGHGEGMGAAMVIPLLDQLAALAARR